MSVEEIENGILYFPGGFVDVHTHPRGCDGISLDDFVLENLGQEGKAGLDEYTRVALKAGFAGMIAMPNEMMRLYNINAPGLTETIPFPIATLDRARMMHNLSSQQANIPTAIHFGLDPKTMFLDAAEEIIDENRLHREFESVNEECTSLKIYGDETTGGYNIHTKHIPRVAEIWHERNPEKPIVMHLENENVGLVLREIMRLPKGKEIPIHIAHVSSRVELEAVIEAKEAGMNVTCEVTPHHLFLDEGIVQGLGNYGCVKPNLKTKDDIEFLWANMKHIDMFASDCAPHRRSDKEGEANNWGLANHTVMIPLLVKAVEEGLGGLTYEDLYEKLCLNPRKRFNLPADPDSHTIVDTKFGGEATSYEGLIRPRYGHNPFLKVHQQFNMIGRVIEVKAGESHWTAAEEDELARGGIVIARKNIIRASYRHALRPKNFNQAA